MKTGISEAIRASGGAIFAVTSEPQNLAAEAQESWELDFPSVGDPHHEIAKECRERGWLSLFVNRAVGLVDKWESGAVHPNGYFQPGVLALSRGRVLYRWRGRPTRHNAGGATHRPSEAHVWERIQHALGESDVGDAPLDEPKETHYRAPPWPLFVGMLLANGKFLRPKGFGLSRRGPNDVREQGRRAVRNLILFVAGWVTAFVFLPTTWVGVALAAWAACVTPGIIEVHREFQSVPEGEPEGN